MEKLLYNRDKIGQVVIIENSKYKGYEYYIVSYGSHPCCYVIPHITFNSEEAYKIDVHGGITWNERFLPGKLAMEAKKYGLIQVLGWDYNHLGDRHLTPAYLPSVLDNPDDKMWTYEELLNDVHNVIDQIIKLENPEKGEGGLQEKPAKEDLSSKSTETLLNNLVELNLQFIRTMNKCTMEMERAKHKVEEAFNELQDKLTVESHSAIYTK